MLGHNSSVYFFDGKRLGDKGESLEPQSRFELLTC